MERKLRDVVVVDAVRTPFGKAGEKGVFWNTRADDLVISLLRALIRRNSPIKPEYVEDSIWGVTNQIGEQGGTLGRMVTMLADWGWSVPGCSVDRMCASGLTTVTFGATYIATGMADCIVAGGVEHMGHLPMGYMRDPHPRSEEVMGGASAFVMGETAENLHEICPDITRELCDEYSYRSHMKAVKAIREGKMKNMIIPVEAKQPDGSIKIAEEDEHPRADTSIEALANLKPRFRENGRVTAGNASGLNDGAAAVLLMSAEKAEELGLTPRMRWIASAVVGVDPKIMGIAPVPATQKALKKAGISLDNIDFIELNEAFAVQAIHNISGLGLKLDDSRVNPWGGAIAYGHPLAASGPRLVAFLMNEFINYPNTRYGITTMCVGRGQGFAILWESLV